MVAFIFSKRERSIPPGSSVAADYWALVVFSVLVGCPYVAMKGVLDTVKKLRAKDKIEIKVIPTDTLLLIRFISRN
jgi:hypothetical protein